MPATTPEERAAVVERTARRASIGRRALVVADLLGALVAVGLIGLIAGSTPQPVTLLTGLVVIVAGKVSSLYDRDQNRLRKSTLEEVPALFQLSGICALLLWLGDGAVFETALTRSDVLLLWLALFTSITSARAAGRVVTSRLVGEERCLMVGEPGAMAEVADRLTGRRARVVGSLPLQERRGAESGQDPCADLEDIITRTGAHRVIVVPGGLGEEEAVLSVVSRAQTMGIYVSILPRMGEVVGSSVEFDHVDGMTLLGVHPFGLSRSSRMVKRGIDVVGAAFGLVVLAPLFAVAALAVRLGDRGPAFYRQPRVGHGGRRFAMIKFRTMHVGADRLRDELIELSSAGDGLFKVAGDPRITPVGRWLRRYSLDELPQLINVLRGDMSLVGPRPLVIEEDAQVEGRHRRRLHLTPGMTGPWQVLGTADQRIPLRQMVTLDYLYVGNWSLWTDIKILLRTALHVVKGRGL